MHQLHQQRPIDKTRNATTSLPSNLRMLKAEGGSGLQKLLKEELRMTIMAKRHARGQSDLDLEVDFPNPEPHELSLADLERRERRREQNRRAAQRCRRKKRINQLSVLQNYEWIVTRNQQLEQELDVLRQERQRVHSVLRTHSQACTCPGHHALTSLLPHVMDPSSTHSHPSSTHTHPSSTHTHPTSTHTHPSSSTTTTTTHTHPVTTTTVKVEPPGDGEEAEMEYESMSSATAVRKFADSFQALGMEAGASCESSSSSSSSSSMWLSTTSRWQQYNGSSSDCVMTSSCNAVGSSCLGQPSYSNSSSSGGNLNSQACGYSTPVTTIPFTTTTTSSTAGYPPHPHISNGTSSVAHCFQGAGGMTETSAGVRHSGASRESQPLYSGCDNNSSSSLTSLVSSAASVLYPSGGGGAQCALQGGGMPVPAAIVVGQGVGISSSSAVGGPLSFLDELAYAPRGLRASVFQEEAATPLSADGRRSISSVSSDVSSALSSAAAEHPGDVSGGEAVSALPSDFYVSADDLSSANDVSQLLSQINQSDLIFQQDGGAGLDEVFRDSVDGMNLSEHFLHHL